MVDDPFEFFKRTMDQFDPDKVVGPDNFGALGWPMTPFRPPGMGSAPLSPEAGTKHAITQLYTAIEELSDRSLISGGQPFDFWQQYATHFGIGDYTQAEASEQVGRMVLGSYQVWLYSLAQLLVESYTLRLLNNRLINEEYRNKMGTQEWLWELPQSDREEILRRCTDIEGELIDEMEGVRTRRNDLFYNLGRWDQVTKDNPVDEARRTLHVLKQLDSTVSNDEGYQFFPSEDGAETKEADDKNGEDNRRTSGESEGSDGEGSEAENNPE